MTKGIPGYDFLFDNNIHYVSNFNRLRNTKWTQVPEPENERLQSLFKEVYD